MIFFEKKTRFFLKFGQCGKFAVACVSNDINVFSTLILIFFSKYVLVANLPLNAYQMILVLENVFCTLIVRFLIKKSDIF